MKNIEDVAAALRRRKLAIQRGHALATFARIDRLYRSHDVSDEPRDDHGQWTDGGGDDGGSSGGSGSGFVSASPNDFIAARDRSTRQNFMSPLKPDDLSGHTLIMNKDKTIGVAIDPHGDMQNVFNNGGQKGAAANAVTAAIGQGARTLDCYAGFLPDYYHQFGFVKTGRMKFDPAFAHGWDVEKHGTPDVVFMAWKGYINGDSQAAIDRAKGPREQWIANEPSRTYATDYDAAKAASRSDARGKGYRGGAGKKPRPSADAAGNQPVAGTGKGDRRTLVKGDYIQDPATGRLEGSQPGPGHGGGGGSSGGGGDYKPPAATVSNYNPGQRTPKAGSFEQAKVVKQQWIATSPVTSMDAAKRLAPEGQKMLNGVARNIASKVSGVHVDYAEHKLANPRGEPRVLAKAEERKDRGGIAAVSDLARVTFVIDHPDKAAEVFAELSKHFETVSEPQKMTDVNYSDRAANVRLPNGVIGEVQVMSKAMASAKNDMHKYYEISRVKGAEQDNKAQYDDAVNKQRTTYAAVLQSASPEWQAVYANAVKVKNFLRWLGKRLRAAAALRQILQ